MAYGYDDIGVRMFWRQGTVDTHYFGSVSIRARCPIKAAR